MKACLYSGGLHPPFPSAVLVSWCTLFSSGHPRTWLFVKRQVRPKFPLLARHWGKDSHGFKALFQERKHASYAILGSWLPSLKKKKYLCKTVTQHKHCAERVRVRRKLFSIQSRFIADQGQSQSTIWVACELKCAEIQHSGTNFCISSVWLATLHVWAV